MLWTASSSPPFHLSLRSRNSQKIHHRYQIRTSSGGHQAHQHRSGHGTWEEHTSQLRWRESGELPVSCPESSQSQRWQRGLAWSLTASHERKRGEVTYFLLLAAALANCLWSPTPCKSLWSSGPVRNISEKSRWNASYAGPHFASSRLILCWRRYSQRNA